MLFVDLVGFTSFAEGRDDVRAMLDNYFDGASDAYLEELRAASLLRRFDTALAP